MATIYQKTASDRCIILAPKEGLKYPFSLGAWTELRFGGFFSVVGTSSDVALSANETIIASSPSTRMFLGLKNSDNDSIPGVSGASFFGFTNKTAGNSVYQQSPNSIISSNSNSPVYSIIKDSNTVSQNAISTSSEFFSLATPSTTMTGQTSYAQANMIKINLDVSRKIYSGYFCSYPGINNAGVTDVSVASLQSLLASSVYTLVGTGYWTDDGTSAGNFFTRPDAVYFYMPFINNRLVVHSIYADKYA